MIEPACLAGGPSEPRGGVVDGLFTAADRNLAEPPFEGQDEALEAQRKRVQPALEVGLVEMHS